MILLGFPILWAFLFLRLRKTDLFRKFAPHPTLIPWDYVFGKSKSYWIIVQFEDGSLIGGKYDTESFVSSYPEDEQIFLEELWEIGDNDAFIKKLTRSEGALISGENIRMIRMYN